MIDLASHPGFEVFTPRPPARATQAGARARVLTCHQCDARDPTTTPRCAVTVAQSAPAYVVVTGTELAPEAHRLLAAWLLEYRAGEVPVVSRVNCGTKYTNRAHAACGTRFGDQLQGLGYPPVVLVGDSHIWRDDLHDHTVGGYSFVWGWDVELPGVWMFMLGDVARCVKEPGYKSIIQHRIEVLRECVDVGFAFSMRMSCVVCQSVTRAYREIRYDGDGVPYCPEHWTRWQNEWVRQRRRGSGGDGGAQVQPHSASLWEDVIVEQGQV